jgi:hypothetical protein
MCIQVVIIAHVVISLAMPDQVDRLQSNTTAGEKARAVETVLAVMSLA